MPGAIRSNKKAAKIAYTLLKVPKDQQQKTRVPSRKVRKEWFSDLGNAQ